MIRRAVSAALLLAAVVMAGGCGGDEPVERVVVAELSFAAADSAGDSAYHPLQELFNLTEGWRHLEDEGIWTDGPRSTLEFHAPGDSLVLELIATTSPPLVERGQTLAITVNGLPLAHLDFPQAWQAETLSVAIPDSLARRGWNEVALLPRTTGWNGMSGEPGVYVTGLRVTCRTVDLDPREIAAEQDGDYRIASAPRKAPPVPEGGRPDVLMILPDAARADHFGCYGYGRDTTPFVDALAADGVVFEKVLAAAPYTINSATTILTGRNWVDHGVMFYGQALGPDLPTLAGILADAGVHTMGFSENPNVSPSVGNDRGFAEFYDCWLPGPDNPGALEDLLERSLAAAPADQPLFGYAHLLPPHDPYFPPPEHDLFSNPAYPGPADGSVAYIDSIDTGKRDWTPGDRDHLRDLYDGNLRLADARTGDIVARWRAGRPGRELVVIVLSDHGEAFAEHGRFLHNSTLHDEMLHVPLVISPARWGELLPDPDGMRGLEDVMPMVLRIMAAPLPKGSTWPRAFLDVYAGRAEARTHIVLRTAGDTQLGLRTPDHLVVQGRYGDQALFHLPDDPGQKRNRIKDDPYPWLRMLGTARLLVEQGLARSNPAPQATVDPAAAERLKALGY